MRNTADRLPCSADALVLIFFLPVLLLPFLFRSGHAAGFAPVTLRTGVTYLDGVGVGRCAAFSVHSGTEERNTGPAAAQAHIRISCPQPSDGRLAFQVSAPGRYELEFTGFTAASFNVTADGAGVLTGDLPEVVRLPFNYILETEPGREVALYNFTGSGAGGEKRVAADREGRVFLPGRGSAGGPGTRNPVKDTRRIIRFDSLAGRVWHVRNVERKTRYSVVRSGGRADHSTAYWLFGLDEKESVLQVAPVPLPQELPVEYRKGEQNMSDPKLYLSDTGEIRLAFSHYDSTARITRYTIMALAENLTWHAADDPFYPAFTFQNRPIIGKKWLVPTWGGIPARTGTLNSLRFSCEVSYDRNLKANETCHQAYIRYQRSENPGWMPVPEYGYAENCRSDPKCDCPEDSPGKAVVSRSFDFTLQWNPIEKKLVVEPPLDRKARAALFEDMRAGFTKEYGVVSVYEWGCELFLNGEGPLRVIDTVPEDNTIVGPALPAGLTGDENDSADSGVPRLVPASRGSEIDLLEGFRSEGVVGELLNPKEGPYPSLRYRQSLVVGSYPDPEEARSQCPGRVARHMEHGRSVFGCTEQTHIEVCPQNYGWSISAREGIVIDRSRMTGQACREVSFAEPAGTRISLEISAPGYRTPAVRYFFLSGEIGRLPVNGIVTDTLGNPVEGAVITLPERNLTVTSDGEGRYAFPADQPPQARAWQEDFVLERVFDKIEAELEVVRGREIYANGRSGLARLRIIADGRPYAGREVTVLPTGRLEMADGSASILKYVGTSDSRKVVTDGQGYAEVEITGPRIVPGALDPRGDPGTLFPAGGYVELRGEWDRRVLVPFRIENPVPRISRLIISGNVDEENWQVIPSRIFIEDPDSTGGWTVTVEVIGKIKERYGAVQSGRLQAGTDSSPFLFHYKPPRIGLDLNREPELGRQLLMVNLKAALNVILAVAENRLDRQNRFSVKDLGPADDISIDILHAVPLESKDVVAHAKTALSYLDRATDTMNVVSGPAPAALDEQMISGFDYVFAQAETAFGLLGGKTDLGFEFAKTAYENAKVFYKVYKGELDIANAYQDVIFLPVTVTVEDELGHKTVKTGKCAVRIWRKS